MIPSVMGGVCLITALKDSCGCSVAKHTRKSSERGRNCSHEKDKRDRITRRLNSGCTGGTTSSCREKQMVLGGRKKRPWDSLRRKRRGICGLSAFLCAVFAEMKNRERVSIYVNSRPSIYKIDSNINVCPVNSYAVVDAAATSGFSTGQT